MCIRFEQGVLFSPFRVTRCRQVPLYMKDEADALLADLEQKGVLGRLECWTKRRTTFSVAILSPSPEARGCGW